MSPLVRRTTLVLISLALVTTGCAGKKKVAAPAATSAPATTAPSSAPPAATSASPAATESPVPTQVDPAAIAAAKKLLVVGKDYGKGWKEEIDEMTGPQEDSAFCSQDAPKSEAAKVVSVSSDVTNPADPQNTFNHEITLYRAGGAKAALDEFNALLAVCKPVEEEGVSISAKQTGPNEADVTMKFGEITATGALRFAVRGDYVSVVFALGKTHAAARKLADQVTAKAAKKFDAANIT